MKNPQLNEQVSALADGELAPDESRFALRRLEADADLRQSWSRLHLARDVLRRDALQVAPAGFAQGVIDRLDAESARSAGTPWLKTAAGGLIAAGVAAAALFAVAPREATAPAGVAPPAPMIASTTPITTEDLRPRIGSLPASDSIVTPLRASYADPRLDQYLIEHSDAARGGTRGGYMPYVYIVSGPGGAPRPPLREAPAAR